MLKHFGVTPFLVFDGDYLPSKAATEKERAKRREESRKAGLELLKAGKTSTAYQELQKAVDVTPEMARMLIEELKTAGVQYIVAPYEADPQMVYLERIGVIDGILSEDSDLLVFGAKCLLTKLDQYGNCIEINKADFCACKDVCLTGWSDKEFRRMAILSGCDYLASINNMGLKTAYRMVRKHKTIEKILRMLQFDGKWHVPKGYLEAFYQAELTFLHQRVFCPKVDGLVLHTEPEQPIDEEKMPFIGAFIEPEIARGVARGDLNPMTKEPIIIKKSTNTVVTPAPRRSSLPNMQRSSGSLDVKKGRPIDTFFQSKRIPLAELDPNAFTLSPSQEQALQRNRGPWTAHSAPRPYLRQSLSAVDDQLSRSETPRVQPAPRPVRVASATISEPRPQKRARLCADPDDLEGLPGPKVELCQSPFFASKMVEPSPTVNRTNRRKSYKKDDIQIFSDDSIEEALMSLPDTGSLIEASKISSKSATIFREEPKANDTHPVDQLDASPVARDTTTPSQNSIPGLTPSTSSASLTEEAITPAASPDTPTMATSFTEDIAESPMDALVTKFKFNRNGLVTPSSISSKPSRIPLPVKTHMTPNSIVSKAAMSPLQRLGAASVNRAKFPPMAPSTSVASNLRKPRSSLLGKGCIPFQDVVEKTKTPPLDPAMIPLPPVDEAENQSLAGSAGSEDLIIPDSEGEDEALSPGGCSLDRSKGDLDLGRFLYVG